MPAVLINDAEWELLAGEPAELLKLYVALKRRMDFATGIAGHKTLLSEIVLREGFTVDPIPGRPKPTPVTREKYRSAVRRLERLGVIRVIGPLVFEFPHARRDQSAQNSYNRATTELQPTQQPNRKALQPSNDAASSDSDAGTSTGLFSEQCPSYNLLPVSGKALPPPSPRAGDTRRRFAMTADWQPDPKTFPTTLFTNGLAGVQLDHDVLVEFRSFWTASPDEHRTQAKWEHALAQRLKEKLRHEQANGRASRPGAGKHRTGRPGSRSTVERVRDNIEAAEAARQASGTPVAEDGRDVRPPLDVEFRRVPES